MQSTAGELSLPDIIQLAAMNRRSLRISVSTVDGNGEVFVRDGEVVHAAFVGLHGREAFYALFEAPHLGFQISNLGETSLRTIDLSGQHLLLEAARRSDEASISNPKRLHRIAGSVTGRTQVTSAPPSSRRSLGNIFVPVALLVSLVGMAALGLNFANLRENRTPRQSPVPEQRPFELAELGADSTRPEVLQETKAKHPGVDLPLTPTIVLRLLVGRDGKVQDSKVYRPRTELAAFEMAALRAAKQTLFKPATRASKPVAVWLNFPVSFVGAQPEKTLRVKGSDTIGAALGPELGTAYRAQGGGPVSFEALGSNTAFAGLFDGTADIGAASRTIDKKELDEAEQLGVKLQEFVIGYDGIAIIVHPNNPVRQITLEQAAGVFGGAILAWPAIAGGQGNAIHPISRPSYSGTHGFFKERVLRVNDPTKTREFAPNTRFVEKSSDVALAVSQDVLAVGYVGLEWVTPGVRAVPVAAIATDTPVLPNAESVRAGTYPIYRPLLMYRSSPPSDEATEFLQFVLSDAGQAVVEKHGFIRSDASLNTLANRDPAETGSATRPKLFRILFSQKSAYLDADAQEQVGDIALRMKRSPLRALIIGHSDAQGSGRSNERHAALRAQLIADSLEREGIARSLLRIEDASSAQPVASNSSELGRDLNRRVDVFLVPR